MICTSISLQVDDLRVEKNYRDGKLDEITIQGEGGRVILMETPGMASKVAEIINEIVREEVAPVEQPI